MNIKRPAPTLRPMVRKQAPKLKIQASLARSRSASARDEEDDYYDNSPEPNMKLSHAFVVVLVLHVIAVGGVFAFQSIKNNQRPPAVTASAGASNAATATSPTTALPEVPANQTTASSAQSTLPATTQSSTKPAPAANSAMQHEVKAGETLHKIASMHGVSVAAIQEVNEISDPTKIRIGTMLVIPKSGSASSAAPAVKAPAQATQTTPPRPVVAETAAAPAKPIAPAAPETTKDSGKVYEVVKGDNPVSIAKKLNVSYNELLALNKIDDPRKLQIGQKLKVPESK